MKHSIIITIILLSLMTACNTSSDIDNAREQHYVENPDDRKFEEFKPEKGLIEMRQPSKPNRQGESGKFDLEGFIASNEKVVAVENGTYLNRNISETLNLQSYEPPMFKMDRGIEIGVKIPKEHSINLKEAKSISVEFKEESFEGGVYNNVWISTKERPLVHHVGLGSDHPIVYESAGYIVEQTKVGEITHEDKLVKIRSVATVFKAKNDGGIRTITILPGKTTEVPIDGKKYNITLLTSKYVESTEEYEEAFEGSPFMLEFVLTAVEAD